jgi:hypothetical protein
VFQVSGKPLPAANLLKVWRDNKGSKPDWLVHWIAVKPGSSEQQLYFWFDSWLKSEDPVSAYVPWPLLGLGDVQETEP